MKTLAVSARIFALPRPGAFALPRRGVVKIWTATVERMLVAALKSEAAPSGRPQGLAEFSLVLDEQGALSDIRMDRTSGSEPLDRACLDAMTRIAPFPAPPMPVVESQILIQMEFVPDREAVA